MRYYHRIPRYAQTIGVEERAERAIIRACIDDPWTASSVYHEYGFTLDEVFETLCALGNWRLAQAEETADHWRPVL